jgi:hypothetical protein
MDNAITKIERFTYDIIYYVLWIIEITLLLRFIFKLLGANPQNQLVSFLYSISLVLMGPFKDIFGFSEINNMVLEPNVLISMVFYAIVAYILVSFVKMISQTHSNRPMVS